MKTYVLRVIFKDGTAKIVSILAENRQDARGMIVARYTRAKIDPRRVTII